MLLFRGQFQDFGYYQVQGRVRIETMAPIEVLILRIMLQVLLLAVHHGVLRAEEGPYQVGRIGILAYDSRFGIELLGLKLLVFSLLICR